VTGGEDAQIGCQQEQTASGVRKYECTGCGDGTRRIPGIEPRLDQGAIIRYRESGLLCCRLVKRRLRTSGWGWINRL